MNPQTLLINLQKYIVHAKKDAQENPWHINDLLPAVVAYIFPFYQELLKSKDKGNFQELVLALKPFVSRNKNRLSEYSFDALCMAVRDKWIPELENPFLLLKTISSIYFKTIDENGYVFLNPITINSLMGRPFDDLPRQYGTSDYAAQEMICATSAQVQRERVPLNNNQIDSKAMNDAKTELIELFKNLGETRKNNPNCYRYDVFEKWQLTDLNTYPQYTWQWNFTCEEYGEIKKLLKEQSSIIKQILGKKKEEVTKEEKICCKVLQLFVSEWYKREYNGSDGEEKAFATIGIEKNRATDVLNILLDNPDEMVFRSNVDENGCLSGQREWLGTIYVDGGLPLNYFSSKESTYLRKAIEHVWAINDKEYAERVFVFGEQYGSKGPVYQSYGARVLFPDEKDTSIYDFIQEWLVDENIDIPEYAALKKQLIEGGKETKKQSLLQKFVVRYRLFKTAKYFQLIPELYFREGPCETNYSISQERLGVWNVHPQDNGFLLTIKNSNNIISEMQFVKCLRGDYISFLKKDRFDLNVERDWCLKPWDVWIDDKLIAKESVGNKLQEKGYIQMYSTDGFSWYSQSSKDYQKTAVLFDRKRCNSFTDDEQSFIYIDGEKLEDIGWKTIDETLSFFVDETEITLFNRAGDLSVRPKAKPFAEYDFKNKDTDGNELYLIYRGEKPNLDVTYSKDGGENNIQILEEKDYDFKCRYGNSGEFSPLESIDKCGYVVIKILTRKGNKKERTIRCFVVPKEANIKNYNDGNSKRTDFKDFGDLTIRYKEEILTMDDNGVRRKYWGKITEEDYHHPEATYQLTDGVANLELSVPKPLDATVVKKSNGSIIGVGRKEKKQRLKLPILVLDKIRVFQLPNNTPKEIDKTRFRSYAFNDLKEYKYRDSYSLPDTYLDLKTFTHTRDNFGDIDLSGLSFVFVPTSHPLDYQPVSLNKELPRFGIDSQEEGIVVQCIKNEYEIPKILLKPIFSPAKGKHQDLKGWEKRDERWKRINKYHSNYENNNPDNGDALAYFDVATETGMYFGVFDALMGLIFEKYYDSKEKEETLKMSDKAAKHLAQFYKCYREKCDEQGISPKYDALWRLADEFMFDWCLIPQSEWNKVFENLSAVKELLSYRHQQVDWLSISLKNKDIKDDNQNIILRTITGSYKGGKGRNSYEKASFWNVDLNTRVRALNSLREINNEIISNYIEVKR